MSHVKLRPLGLFLLLTTLGNVNVNANVAAA